MKIISKVGDIFLIPLDESSAAGGHVISIREGAELYIAVFGQRLHLGENNPEVAIAGEPVLLTLTFDAKLYHGDWPIIGNVVAADGCYPEPAFLINYAGTMSIESRDTSVRRPARENELTVMQYRSVASAMIIENAIKAYFGIGEWKEVYNKRLASYAEMSSKLI